MEQNMNDVYKWLSDYFEYDKPFDEVLKDEKVTSFLLIWPIFEQKLFKEFATEKDICKVADKLGLNYNKYGVEEIVKYFYDRYQDSKKRKHLMHKSKAPFFINILEKDYNVMSDKEKTELLLYVVFRYRNNIFHGNKGIKSWTQYSKEINYCMTVMMNLLDSISKEVK